MTRLKYDRYGWNGALKGRLSRLIPCALSPAWNRMSAMQHQKHVSQVHTCMTNGRRRRGRLTHS